MTGPTTNAAIGGLSATLASLAFDALGTDAALALTFGALGGSTRWMGEKWRTAKANKPAQKWHKGLWSVPLGASLALGLGSIAAPIMAHYVGAANDDTWLREVLSAPSSKNGIHYFLGLFAAQIMSRIDREAEK